MLKKIQLHLSCIFCLLFLLSGKQAFASIINTPTVIVAGKSKLTGTIIRLADTNKNNIYVDITVPHPISGEYVKYKKLVERSGNFSIDIDIETPVALIALSTSLNPEKYLLLKLTNGGTTNIDIAYNADDIKNVDIRPAMNKNDLIHGFEVRSKMIKHVSGKGLHPMYDKSSAYFLDYAKDALSERLAIVNNDTLLSKGLKEVLAKDYRLILYYSNVFDYEGAMRLNYVNINKDNSIMPDIQKIDPSYFRFLKDFKLNDPQYLQCFQFLEFQKEILQNEVLALPEIGESDIPTWLTKVKGILSDLIGFNDGIYYDILAANAYARQLNEEVRPLSEKQKENIISYWNKEEIGKILFRKNQQVVQLYQFKSPAVVNEISSVPEDKVIETIVAKHKGKVIFIDLWATWCVPCLNAMQQFRNTKDEFYNKDVAFVYITNGSSPRKLWEEKIKGIGNEHYYLTSSQWKFIMNHYGFEYIPSYLLFNKEGTLINKFSPFPGSEKVKKIINSLL